MTGHVGPDVDGVGMARLDLDRADRAVDGHRARTLHEVPFPAAVGGLEQSQAGLGVAGPVWLARAGVDRVAARVVGIDEQRAERVRRQLLRRSAPLHVVGESVRCAPDPTARSGNPDPASVTSLAALRVDRHRGHAPRVGRRRADAGFDVEELGRLRRDVGRHWAESLPATGRPHSRRSEVGVRLESAAWCGAGQAIERAAPLDGQTVADVALGVSTILDQLADGGPGALARRLSAEVARRVLVLALRQCLLALALLGFGLRPARTLVLEPDVLRQGLLRALL